MSINKYVKNGKVAVLVSPGLGAGWSTWNKGYEEDLLYNPLWVQWVLDGKDERSMPYDIDSFEGKYGDCHLFPRDLIVEWLEPGTRFFVDEYDGSESIVSGDERIQVA